MKLRGITASKAGPRRLRIFIHEELNPQRFSTQNWQEVFRQLYIIWDARETRVPLLENAFFLASGVVAPAAMFYATSQRGRQSV
jgi:hypothetical protein